MKGHGVQFGRSVQRGAHVDVNLAGLRSVPLRSGAELLPLLTLDEVARILGMSKAWVRDHATRRNPRIPVVRFGDRRGVLRFRLEDVYNFITAHLQVQERGV
ncbi:MAG TPA: helix-turn-helix domain-containing protein [Terriglobales bacterium]|jgi:hypothetical protein|nr:helix-turn-helix domain-containing protein [Terriglobales bacterium]